MLSKKKKLKEPGVDTGGIRVMFVLYLEGYYDFLKNVATRLGNWF